MKKFMCEDFLLSNETAKVLYHNHAKNMPIFDYHCHLIPSEIAEDKKYNNITEIWLYGDHYKWRAMRSFGIDEYYITGESTDFEKFQAFAKPSFPIFIALSGLKVGLTSQSKLSSLAIFI